MYHDIYRKYVYYYSIFLVRIIRFHFVFIFQFLITLILKKGHALEKQWFPLNFEIGYKLKLPHLGHFYAQQTTKHRCIRVANGNNSCLSSFSSNLLVLWNSKRWLKNYCKNGCAQRTYNIMWVNNHATISTRQQHCHAQIFWRTRICLLI